MKQLMKLTTWMFWKGEPKEVPGDEKLFSDGASPASTFYPTEEQRDLLKVRIKNFLPELLRKVGLRSKEAEDYSKTFADDYLFSVLEVAETAYIPIEYNETGDDEDDSYWAFICIGRDGTIRLTRDAMFHKVACQYYQVQDKPEVLLSVMGCIAMARKQMQEAVV